jgi:hypothetical protein
MKTMPGMAQYLLVGGTLNYRSRNADELIKDFWSQQTSRKTEIKGKRGRKSTATLGEESDTDSVPAAPKKRGRKSQPRTGSEESREVDARMPKKARTGASQKAPENNISTQDEDENMDEAIVIADMSKYESWPSWEDLIENIDTIEKDMAGDIMLYFTL